MKKYFKKQYTLTKKALQNSGYRLILTYKRPKNDNNSAKREIIWFNPPFNLKTKTKMGKFSLILLDKHLLITNCLNLLTGLM